MYTVSLCTVVVVSTSTIMCTVYMLICNWPFKRETSTVLIGISSLLLLNLNFFSQLEHRTATARILNIKLVKSEVLLGHSKCLHFSHDSCLLSFSSWNPNLGFVLDKKLHQNLPVFDLVLLYSLEQNEKSFMRWKTLKAIFGLHVYKKW